MLNNQTQEKLIQLKLSGFSEVLREVQQQVNPNQTWDEVLGIMVERELAHRDHRRQSRLLKSAKLRYPDAMMEAVDYQAERQFNQPLYRGLSSGEWAMKARNILLMGPTGVGKSFLACALGYQLCKMGHTVRYYRVPRLMEEMRLAHADGSYPKRLVTLAKTKCLILDDFGIDQLDRSARRDLLEIIEDRSGLTATVITTQLPVKLWGEYIGDQTIADAICDRLLNQAYQFAIKGESMRAQTKLLTHVDH